LLPEIYIIAFALVFGALTSTLTESDRAETGLDNSILTLSAITSTAAFTGAGMALAGYNILSPIAEENIALVVRANQRFLRVLKLTWVGCIIFFVVIIGGLLYQKLEDERDWYYGSIIATSTYVFFALGFIQIQGRP
jgi:hypothetical protein